MIIRHLNHDKLFQKCFKYFNDDSLCLNTMRFFKFSTSRNLDKNSINDSCDMSHVIWVIRFSMSHNRIQDPISAYFNSFFTLWLKLSPFSRNFSNTLRRKRAILGPKRDFFGWKIDLFWVVLKKMQTLKPNPEIVELEIRSSNPLVMKRARNSIHFWPQMTWHDLLTSRKQY